MVYRSIQSYHTGSRLIENAATNLRKKMIHITYNIKKHLFKYKKTLLFVEHKKKQNKVCVLKKSRTFAGRLLSKYLKC